MTVIDSHGGEQATPGDTKRAGPRRVAAASLIGSTIEYYDFSVYGAATALVLGELFFPNTNPTLSTLAALATFAVAFLARPLGVAIFGTVGDRYGRRSALLWCLGIMGAATVGVGLLPTHASIGMAAPIALVALRLLQGIGLGGEWGGAVLLAAEHAPPGRRALYAAIPQIGPPLGFVLAALVFTVLDLLLTPTQFLAWGWRIPFLLSVVMVGVGYYLRRRVDETPAFESTGNRLGNRLSIVDVFRTHTREVALGAGAVVAGSATWYLAVVFGVGYGIREHGFTQSQMMLAAGALAVGHIVLIPPVAVWTDRVGRKLPLLLGALGLAAWNLPMWLSLESENPWLVMAAFLAMAVPITLVFCPIAAFLTELFPVHVRYSGVSAAFTLSHLIGGGVVPLLVASRVTGGGWVGVLGLAGALLALISLLCLWIAPETKDRSIAG